MHVKKDIVQLVKSLEHFVVNKAKKHNMDSVLNEIIAVEGHYLNARKKETA